MTQVTGGLRSILSLSWAYRAFQNLVGARRVRRLLMEDYAKPHPGERLLDIGCGTGDILEWLPDLEYVGFDQDRGYIEDARGRWVDRGRFYCADFRDHPSAEAPTYDLILVLGLLHHLEDEEVRRLFADAAMRLRPGGRLLSLDPCLRPGQPWLAGWLIRHDRGQNVRTLDGYRALAEPALPGLEAIYREDLLRIPYGHAILLYHRPSGQHPH